MALCCPESRCLHSVSRNPGASHLAFASTNYLSAKALPQRSLKNTIKGPTNVRVDFKSLEAVKGKWLHLMSIHTTLQFGRGGAGREPDG